MARGQRFLNKTRVAGEKGRLSSASWLGLCLGLFMIFPTPAVAGGGPQRDRLNLLLITVDTLRADRLSCYGQERLRTPNMDAFSEKGIVFSRAFAHNPTTLAAHTNILLGLTPLYHGVRENANFVVREEFLTLAEHLKANGYSTAAIIGGFPLQSRFGLAQGFDVYDDNFGGENIQKFSNLERRAEAVVQKGLDWLKGERGPWFLWMHCYDPHEPYQAPEPFKTRYHESPYDGEVAYVDYALGRVLGCLRDNGLFERTLVILIGDHGESLGQHGEETHGFLAYNTTIWVPLIVCVPGLEPGRVEQVVCQIDIFPTVLDILGVKKPSPLQGLSLLPAMRGKKLPERIIYFESLYPYYSRGWAPLKGYLSGREKFIESPIPELYDLEDDFAELNNLAGGGNLDKYRQRLTDLMARLSHPENIKAERKLDEESREKLRSLGYISGAPASSPRSFGPQDDIKVLLPFHNKAMRALALYQEGRKQEGLELAKSVITERNDVDVAYSCLATIYKEEGNLGDALEVLKLGLESLPSNYGLILNYSIFLNEAGRYDDVIHLLDMNSVPQMEHDASLWNILGEACFQKGDLEKAVEALKKALSLDSKYAVGYFNLGGVYFSKYLKAGDRESLEYAIQNYQKATQLDPDSVSARDRLGTAYKAAGKTDEAIRCWEKAWELRPDVGSSLLNIGLVYANRGDKAKALLYLNRYKEKFYSSLSPADKETLDALIQKCSRRP
jgi:arylsulfatase A-like enzyme/Flp pilus assembly protein TadD